MKALTTNTEETGIEYVVLEHFEEYISKSMKFVDNRSDESSVDFDVEKRGQNIFQMFRGIIGSRQIKKIDRFNGTFLENFSPD